MGPPSIFIYFCRMVANRFPWVYAKDWVLPLNASRDINDSSSQGVQIASLILINYKYLLGYQVSIPNIYNTLQQESTSVQLPSCQNR